jgi:hypothetical protein
LVDISSTGNSDEVLLDELLQKGERTMKRLFELVVKAIKSLFNKKEAVGNNTAVETMTAKEKAELAADIAVIAVVTYLVGWVLPAWLVIWVACTAVFAGIAIQVNQIVFA